MLGLLSGKRFCKAIAQDVLPTLQAPLRMISFPVDGVGIDFYIALSDDYDNRLAYLFRQIMP